MGQKRKLPGRVPDGYMLPVFRNGIYSHLIDPGKRVSRIPGLQFGDMINIKPRFYRLHFPKVFARAGEPLDVTMSIEYAFNPRPLHRDTAAEEIARSDKEREKIVHEIVRRAVVATVARYDAVEFRRHPLSQGLGRDVYMNVRKQLMVRGIVMKSSEAISTQEVRYSSEQASKPTPPPPINVPPPDDLPDDIPERPRPKRPDVLRDVTRKYPAPPPDVNSAPPSPEAPPPGEAPPLITKRPDVLRTVWRKRAIPDDE